MYLFCSDSYVKMGIDYFVIKQVAMSDFIESISPYTDYTNHNYNILLIFSFFHALLVRI